LSARFDKALFTFFVSSVVLVGVDAEIHFAVVGDSHDERIFLVAFGAGTAFLVTGSSTVIPFRLTRAEGDCG
jgi:hypothetical protein